MFSVFIIACVFSFLLISTIYLYSFIKNITFNLEKADEYDTPKTLVFAPCKDNFPELKKNLISILEQDYKGEYMVVFIVENEKSGAFKLIEKLCEEYRNAMYVISGKATSNGQKNHNILKAIEAVNKEGNDYDIYAFFDNDHKAPANWLTQLVLPLTLDKVEISTFRAFVEPKSIKPYGNILYAMLSNYMYSVNTFSQQAWGGAFAISKENLKKYKLEEIWSKALSHDCPVNGLKAKILFNPLCIPEDTSYNYTVAGFSNWIKRQFTNWRLFSPKLWNLSFFGITSNLSLIWAFVITFILSFFIPQCSIYANILGIYILSSFLIFSLFLTFKMKKILLWTPVFYVSIPIFLTVMFDGFVHSLFKKRIHWSNKEYVIGKDGSVVEIIEKA